MTNIERFLNGRNAVEVLTELGFDLEDSIETVAYENGKFFIADMRSTESDTRDECLAKAELLYLLADGVVKFPLLHFIAIKNGNKFNYYEKTEFDARTKASQELGWCSDFYQVTDETKNDSITVP